MSSPRETGPATEEDDVDPLVQVLLDERDITRLCHRYATALDGRDWELLRTCFLADVVADYGGTGRCEGYQAVQDLCRRALSPLTRSQHLIGNVVVTVDGDRATSTCYLQAQHVRTGTPGGDNYIIAGAYADDLVRTGDGWRIAARRLETWWTDGNPAVVGR